MSSVAWTLVAVAAGLAVLAAAGTRGRSRAASLGALLLVGGGAGWWLNDRPDPTTVPAGTAQLAPGPVTSADCAQCHQRQYDTWHRTYHRTMTREATPENVKGDFDNVTYQYDGITTRLTREGDEFFMETVDPGWAALRARSGGATAGLPPPATLKLRVDRVVGSHWLQECLHRAPDGRYVRLPVLYHRGERRWVSSNGAFLVPDTTDFWAQSRGAVWNETCLYCHNTGPSKNPVRGPGARPVGYDTTVVELGIACEACHGPTAAHVRYHRDPAARTPPPDGQDVVQPARLSVARRDDVCARCHGALVPDPAAWDPVTHRDPFVPGQDLTWFNFRFRSEAEQADLARGCRPADPPAKPGPTDGRFWGDGTPLTTALEYNGLALSACYQKGQGGLSCLSCHTMHGDDPNMLLKPAMGTNEACYKCHAEYRGRLAEHTRHPADSAGSLCYNCHMPPQVYSLMTTHRSHRIQVPALADSLDTGKPHACNLCHLDKSLGWTRDRLAEWPSKGRPARRLSPEEETTAAAVLDLARADARTRVVVAGAFSNPAARAAAGTDWYGPFLTRLLEHERYPAVRYLAHRGLRSAYGDAAAGPFDFLAPPADRRSALQALRDRFDATPMKARPHLPLTPAGRPDAAALGRLLSGRHDPDVSIHE